MSLLITFNERPLKVEYKLTSLGKSLIPAIEFTAQWGEDNREELEKLIVKTQL
jgi:DNA-binding HxlR family transcriptional regulator